jgi:murein DD-endopeptidase MepM/ murein hydrolase activator NlpD
MKFQSPVGTEEERNSGKIWPGGWTDATGFLNAKAPSYAYGIHTGADLNLNLAGNWDADKLAPVYSIGDGIVTYAQMWPNPKYWGNIVIIDHGIVDGKPLYSRYAHVAFIRVRPGDVVKMGQQICQVGHGGADGSATGLFSYHLHFDISYTKILRDQPQNWPAPSTNKRKELVMEHYVDPEKWLQQQHAGEGMPEVMGNTNTVPSDIKPPRVNINPIMPTWYVIAPEITIYKKPSTTSEKSGTLTRGKQLFLGNEGVRNQDMEWGKIVGGPFDSEWVAVRKADKSQSFISTNQPK